MEAVAGAGAAGGGIGEGLLDTAFHRPFRQVDFACGSFTCEECFHFIEFGLQILKDECHTFRSRPLQNISIHLRSYSANVFSGNVIQNRSSAMSAGVPDRQQVDRFIVDEIDSVPQLEALLLFWKNRPQKWSSETMAKALYVAPEVSRDILAHLAQRHLIAEVEGNKSEFVLNADSEETERLLASLDVIYRRELVRVSNMIHTKASRGVRDFADAFRLKKE